MILAVLATFAALAAWELPALSRWRRPERLAFWAFLAFDLFLALLMYYHVRFPNLTTLSDAAFGRLGTALLPLPPPGD